MRTINEQDLQRLQLLDRMADELDSVPLMNAINEFDPLLADRLYELLTEYRQLTGKE